MSEAKIVRVRNVNDALKKLRESNPEGDTINWRRVAPRGMPTIEHKGTFITEYTAPRERVLFSPARDANPFFHFFESLWILGGRRDVAFLTQFNAKIAEYSDNGIDFHAAYGWRIRHHFRRDQLLAVIALMREDPQTRRAVISIWDPAEDFKTSKDIPCNDMMFFKLRDGVMDMTVANRSNDAIWGAYGANAVQFSMIHEFISLSLGAQVGVYRQTSDSFHIYEDNEAWARIKDEAYTPDPYSLPMDIQPYPIMASSHTPSSWLTELALFFNHVDLDGNAVERLDYKSGGFFNEVVAPMWNAWKAYKAADTTPDKNARIARAQSVLYMNCAATDWTAACVEWLNRRKLQ